MRAREFIMEMPKIISPISFGLEDDTKNRLLAHELLGKKQETLEKGNGFELFLTGDKFNGYIALYVDEIDLLGYVIKYRAGKSALVGKTITQVALWRRGGGTLHVPGITRRVFFDHLLKIWPTIMSDGQQTPSDEEFWRSRMAEASIGSYRVGILNFSTKTVKWWDRAGPFSVWLKETEGWGKENKHEYMRYLISSS